MLCWSETFIGRIVYWANWMCVRLANCDDISYFLLLVHRNKKSQKSPELKSWPSFYFMEAVGTLVWVQCVYKVGGSIHQRRKKLSIDHNPPVMMECKHKMRAEMGQKHLWSCNSNFVTLNTARPRVMRFFVHKKTSLINR